MSLKRRKTLNNEVKIVGINHGLCLASNLYSEGWKRETFTDVKFYCKPLEADDDQVRRKPIRANRSVLAAVSPFFASILPDSELETDVCISTELDYDNLFAVLEYIYSGRLLCTNDCRDELIKVLKQFEIFIPIDLQESVDKEVDEIELIIEQDDDEISDSESVHIDLQFEEGKADLVLGGSSDSLPHQQFVLQPSNTHPKVYQKKNTLTYEPPVKVSIPPPRKMPTPPPDDYILLSQAPDRDAVTLSIPIQFFGSSSTNSDLERNQLKRISNQNSQTSPAYPLSSYHNQTWLLGLYSPFDYLPDSRLPELLPFEDPLLKLKGQPLIHDWTSFRQPTFLAARPKVTFKRRESSGVNNSRSKMKTLSSSNSAVLKLADIRSMKTHKGKIHVTLNGDPPPQSNLPYAQVFTDGVGVNHAAQHINYSQHYLTSDGRSARGPGRPKSIFHGGAEHEESDKIDLALARHFLQEEVRTKQRLQFKSKMLSDRLAQYKDIAQSILERKSYVEERKAHKIMEHRQHQSGSNKKSGPQTQCEQCGKMVLASRLKIHLKIHSGVKSHLCELCGRAFLLKAYLNAHIRINHSQRDRPKRFMCSSCGYTCDQKHKLEVHERTHTDERPFECQYCDKRFREKGTLVRHIRTHTGERPYACNICGTSYAARDTYVQHYKRKHEQKAEGQKSSRPRAKPSNVVIYRCEYCQKGFYRLLAYEKHRATHTGVAPAVKCSHGDCDFTYSEMSAFKDHMATFHPNKTYTCNVCAKVFLTKQNLSNHQSKHDPNLGFHCSHCSLSLTTKASLIAHERIHTREKPYECNYCGMSFHSPYLIKIHLRKHQPNHPKRKRSRRPDPVAEEEQAAEEVTATVYYV